MHVASETKKVAVADLMRVPLLMRHPASLCPSAEHFLALIPTKWGMCGAVWKYHEANKGADFAAAPVSARLCRIVTPGLPINSLRRQLMGQHALCNEVFGDGHGGFHPEVVPDWFPELVRYLQSYYANSLRDTEQAQCGATWGYWRPRLDWSGLTEFQRKVLETVAGIGRGQKRTYGEIAKMIGSPRSTRAVGAALGSNPWPVLIPCHRVVGAGGRMTGFSAPGGVGAKKRMLAMEVNLPLLGH